MVERKNELRLNGWYKKNQREKWWKNLSTFFFCCIKILWKKGKKVSHSFSPTFFFTLLRSGNSFILPFYFSKYLKQLLVWTFYTFLNHLYEIEAYFIIDFSRLIKMKKYKKIFENKKGFSEKWKSGWENNLWIFTPFFFFLLFTFLYTIYAKRRNFFPARLTSPIKKRGKKC